MNVDFSSILFWTSVATGLFWFADRALFQRAAVGSATRDASGSRTAAPGWIAWPSGLFPVILAVFAVRSFLFEPFAIPSGSMMPTLEVGDRILVDKFAYGIRLPILGTQLLALGSPRRGDVVVFRYPLDPSENYVKRVVGLPGDTLVYRDKQLSINGRPVTDVPVPDLDDDGRRSTRQRIERLPREGDAPVDHRILIEEGRTTTMAPIAPFAFRDRCIYTDRDTALTCTVPQGHYFMMGDNRDNSADSRFWGFVPDANLVGPAVLIWMNVHAPGRIGPLR